MKVILMILVALIVVISFPISVIISLNGLFPSLQIPLNPETWFYALILLGVFFRT